MNVLAQASADESPPSSTKVVFLHSLVPGELHQHPALHQYALLLMPSVWVEAFCDIRLRLLLQIVHCLESR